MEKKRFYLEEQTGAAFYRDAESNTYTLTFQTAEIKLSNSLEAELLKQQDPLLERTIAEAEDELVITVHPQETVQPFSKFRKKGDYAKQIIGHSLIRAVAEHHSSRLHLIVCPENLLVTEGLDVHFIHYGIKESLPPYEKNEEKLFAELKTTLLVLLDGEYRFVEYMNFTDTMKLSARAKKLLEADTIEALLSCVETWIQEEERRASQMHMVPKQKWRLQKSLFFAVTGLLIPAVVFTVYALFFLHPRHDAFIASNEAYINSKPSDVITALEPYNPSQMPRVVQYQLAQSYVANEDLNMDQTANVQNTLTLQAEELYFQYWIAIGRGENEEANEIARQLQDGELEMYANLKWRDAIRQDLSLSGDEREELLNDIQADIDRYMREQQEREAEEEEDAAADDNATEEEPEQSEERSEDGEENEHEDEPEQNEEEENADE
ncbi:ESX secretion system protein YukC [Shouchella clausii]|jgi:type VII secretion protein EssB|uniref:type VII secretion protein EssB n=1 Tax=Shouchella clausii TaxID=79880 RepID=UPI001B03E44E|nr:type VII secretion protein EssB [Shouchella clausii]GIN15577.1 ESX secretion system protein YukC [Shouchella clausii]